MTGRILYLTISALTSILVAMNKETIHKEQDSSESVHSLAVMAKLQKLPLKEKIAQFSEILATTSRVPLFRREIIGTSGNCVHIRDPFTGDEREMLMFGSNNYLGLANHPHILQAVKDQCDKFGTGVGGSPLLNGTTSMHLALEKRLAKLKNKKACALFASGYSAALGIIGALAKRTDLVLMDELSHASMIDAVTFHRIPFRTFRHNSTEHVEELLVKFKDKYDDIFVITEGVFSMDGDIPDIPGLLELKKRFGFCLLVDDAHGLGVLGKHGHGVQEHFDTDEIDIILGTFSKTLALTGGFVAADKGLIDFIRFSSRSYIFSASLPILTIVAASAGLDVIENEPHRVKELHDNMRFLIDKLGEKGIKVESPTAILPIPIPKEKDLQLISRQVHEKNIFLNLVEFPAVSADSPRFRVSIMSDHKKEELQRLADVVSEVLQ